MTQPQRLRVTGKCPHTVWRPRSEVRCIPKLVPMVGLCLFLAWRSLAALVLWLYCSSL